MTTTWIVEKSNKVGGPSRYQCDTLDELKQKLQARADSYRSCEGSPPLGELSYRYELDKNDQPEVIYAYYRDKHDIKQRFIRLRRTDSHGV